MELARQTPAPQPSLRWKERPADQLGAEYNEPSARGQRRLTLPLERPLRVDAVPGSPPGYCEWKTLEMDMIPKSPRGRENGWGVTLSVWKHRHSPYTLDGVL